MRHRTHRLGKAGAAVILSIGMVGGVIGAIAGTAAAATTATSYTLTGSAKAVASTLATQSLTTVTTLTATLGTTALAAAKTFTFTLTSTSGTAKFSSSPTIVCAHAATAVPCTSGTSLSASGKVLTVQFPVTATTTAHTIKLSAMHLTTTKAHGAVKATMAVPSGFAAPSPAALTIANAPTVGPVTGNSISASSAPKSGKTATGVSGGTLTIKLHGTTSTNTTATHLVLTANSKTGHVHWNAATVSSTGVSATYITANQAANQGVKPTATTATAKYTQINLTIGDLATGTSATVHVTGVKYNLVTSVGTVTVTPAWTTNNTGTNSAAGKVTYGTFTPTSAVNAVATRSSYPTTVTPSLKATSTPNLKPTGTGQAAGNWTITLTGAKGKGWHKTETVKAIVYNNAGDNCTTANKGYVVLAGAPTGKVTASTNVSATPTFTVTTSATATTCKATSHNAVTVTFTNTGTFTSTTSASNKVQITLSTVKYDTHAGTATAYGPLGVTLDKTGTLVGTAKTTVVATHTPAGPSNASLPSAFVSANTPAVTVKVTTYEAKISPVNVNEAIVGQVPSGDYVCASLGTGSFNVSTTAKAVVKSGNGVVTAKAVYEKTTGSTATVTTSTVKYARFKVTTASSTAKPSVYSLETLAVSAPAAAGTVTVTVKYGSSAKCTADSTKVGGTTSTTAATAYTAVSTSAQIYGATADATAAKILETRFTAQHGTATTCINTNDGTTAATATRPVILATDVTYQDALSSQYLASVLKTGTLLTPVTGLSSVTIAALKTEGVTQVDIVGGPLAVSTKVVAQLETLKAYYCGGSTAMKTGTKSLFIHVTRIWGETQYDTAQDIAQFVASSNVAKLKFASAYAGVNKTKGNGAYNDTAGSASTAPTVSGTVRTAFVASGVEFQDAEAASSPSYGKKIPVLLTTPTGLSTQVTAAIANLTVKQVIVLGGPLAVSNTVVTSLQGLGVAVLRIAGINYTDTSAQLAAFDEGAASSAGLGFGTHHVAVASGGPRSFTDGLAGAAIAGHNLYPQLLTESATSVGQYLTAFLKANGKTVATSLKFTTATVFGGPLAVTPSVIAKIQADIG